MIIAIMIKNLYIAILQRLIISLHNLTPAMKQFGITSNLHQSDGSRYVRHVALVVRSHDIILPCAQLCLCQRILALSVERQELILLIQPLVVNALYRPPSDGTTLSRRQVLHRMERERSEVSHLTTHLVMPSCPKRMSRISQHYHTSERLLNIISRTEQFALALHSGKHTVVVAHHTTKVNRHHHLRPLSDGISNAVVVYLKRPRSHIHHHNLRTHMMHNTRRGSIGIGRHNHLVTLSHSQHTKRQFHSSRSRVFFV